MRAPLATAVAAALLAAGCGGAPAPPARDHATVPAFAGLTRLQACERLLADITRHGGTPDITALRYIADHAAAPRLAADARTAVRDIAHTGIAPVALSLLQDDCAKAGLRLPLR